MNIYKMYFFVFCSILLPISLWAEPTKTVQGAISSTKTKDYTLSIEELYSGLNHPWGIAWYAVDSASRDYAVLVSERNGTLWLLYGDSVQEIVGLPTDVFQSGQGGWFDVLVDNQKRVFLSYARGSRGKNGTAIVTFLLDENAISKSAQSKINIKNLENVFIMNTLDGGTFHFGGMMALDQKQNRLYIGLGERNNRYEAQDKTNHHGTVVMIDISSSNYNSKVVSWGHRNPQGMYFDSVRNKLYETEHGPKGGDEFNLIEEGKNYGWPVISWGKEYATSKQVGEGTKKKGLEQPLHYWTPSPALSGLTAYYGDKFEAWNGDYLAASLKFRQIFYVKLNATGNKVENVDELLTDKFGRIRSIEVAPDGYIYFITDEDNGKIFRISPK